MGTLAAPNGRVKVTVSRAYGYDYDNVSRLSKADFNQQNAGSSTWESNLMNFSVGGITYDANGNIMTMAQSGIAAGVSRPIDQLQYSYKEGGKSNKLETVVDGQNTVDAKLGDFNNGTNSGADYDYDANGNLIYDLNKNISAITYNHLNLPDSIVITGKGVIKYLYDASGTKLKKIVTDRTGSMPQVTTTDYLGSFVYQNDTLQFLSHEEGRVRVVLKTGEAPQYPFDYFVKDYLGNVRLVLTEQSNVGVYAATMETAAAPVEDALFSNVDITRTPKPVGYPADATTSPNDYVARLNATNGQKIGPSLVLRVMAGDTLQIGSKAFY
ncbi:MAG TPA: hypothetical protein VIP81_14835, partial [Chitinophaga sp.]